MSGTDDCASQEIEASTSSNSTRNSKKYSFVRSILKTADSQMLCSHGPSFVPSAERVPWLPVLEKRDFIQSWISAHSKLANSPEKSFPASPVLGTSPAKRSPESPILGYQWRRIKREASSKENCRVSLTERLQHARPDPPVTAKIRIENENSRHSQLGLVDCFDSDSNKTLTSANSPVLNRITNSPILNASRVSCRSRKSAGDSTLKWNNRRSLVRENSNISEALSLSSPLGERTKRIKLEKATNHAKESIESFDKQSSSFSELFVEESPIEVEIISSSSKIPETLSLSTITDEYEATEIKRKNRNDLKEYVDINEVERQHHRPLRFSPIELKAETSCGYYHRSPVRESSSSSDRLLISSPLKKRKLVAAISNDTSRMRTKNRSVKSEAVESLQGFDGLTKVRESAQVPDTVSVSSQLSKNLVPESINSANRLPSPLPSPLAKNVHTRIKSIDTSWIRAKDSAAKCINRLSKIGGSSELSKALSERIEVESSTTNAPEDEIQIESDSDATVSDFIENVETQKVVDSASRKSSGLARTASFEERSSDFVERIPKPRPDGFCDSDETYYSDGDSMFRLRIKEACCIKNSQEISEATSYSREDLVSANRSEIVISQAASPQRNNSSKTLANVTSVNTTNDILKKKRKGKKGSLVAKLQTIVRSQVSNFRIWQYRMSLPDFKNSGKQFVMLKIRERETRYGRHYLTASVTDDSHNLLKSLFEPRSIELSEKSNSPFDKNVVTLVIVPEIIGVVKIPAKSVLKLYPPWEIMDEDRKILNVMFFNVVPKEGANVGNKTTIVRDNKKVIEEFECPCIRAEKLVDSCRVKFSITKPSVMQEIFDF